MKAEPLKLELKAKVFEYLLRLGDDRLVLGHRLSEWCGHAPILEEDVALSNIALDCLGQATAFLRLAGKIEGKGRDEDALSFFRDAIEFRNLQLLEQPNGDFAYTMARQFLFDVYCFYLYEELAKSSLEELAGIAAKALKEVRYHLRHSSEWMLRLGDGTEESHRRLEAAFTDLCSFTPEFFESDEVDKALTEEGIAPDLQKIKPKWCAMVEDVLSRATLRAPAEPSYRSKGSRQGQHTEHLGHMLSEMQILPRSFPGASW